MITIRSSAASSEPTLIGLEVILTTARGTYTISSNGADFSSLFGGGLFGAISWPQSQFRLAPGVVLGFHRGDFGFNVMYRRREPFQCVLKACKAHNVQSNIILLNVKPSLQPHHRVNFPCSVAGEIATPV